MPPRTRRTTRTAGHQQRENEDDRRDGADRPDAAGAKANRRRRLPGRADEACVDETDEQDEQSDACGDGELELHRNGIEDEPAQTGCRQDHDDESVDDDKAHRLGPGERADQRRRDERVDAQSRGERERQSRDDAEQNGHHARGERGHRRDLGELQTVPVDIVGARQDDRVQHDDVGHRDERDHAAANLSGDSRRTLRDFEESIESVHHSTLGSMRSRGLSAR